MGNTASTVASAIGIWLGGIAAHLALLIAPIINRVRPPPHPRERRMADLVTAVNDLSSQVERLRVDLAARQEPFVYQMDIPAVPVPSHAHAPVSVSEDTRIIPGRFPG